MEKEMKRRRHRHTKDLLTLCKAMCFLVQVGLFILGWELIQERIKLYAQTSVLLFFIYTLVLFWLHETYGSLQVGKIRLANLCTAQLLTLLVSDVFLFLISTLSIRQLPNVFMFVVVFLAQVIFSVLWCLLAHRVYSAITPAKHTALVWQTEGDLEAFQTICDYTNVYDVVSTFCAADYEDDPDALLSQLTEVETIFAGSLSPNMRSRLIRFGLNHHITVNLRPSLEDVMVATARHRFLANIPILKMDLGIMPLPVRIVKRAMDIVASSLLLLFTSPVMGIVALLIKMEDHGPVFYRQKRLTQGGKVFEILKFRSMRVDAEKDGVARLASQNDDRITKIGHIIRASRLDELPQLWNILKGDMSLVGPRPERPEIAEQYLEELPQFAARLQVKAGLTGYAQVNGKYNTTPSEKLQMDLMYISEMSIVLDVKLILQTIHIMLKKESTEGVREGSTTALGK